MISKTYGSGPYINQTDLGRVKPGQKVHVTTDTYPEKIYKSRISFISSEAEFTPKNVQTQKERVKLVYRVKIDIPNPDYEIGKNVILVIDDVLNMYSL